MDKMLDELYRLKPSEIIIDKASEKNSIFQDYLHKINEFALINQNLSFSDESEPDKILKEQFSDKLLNDSEFQPAKQQCIQLLLP